jgi:ubiquinone/menaquinone biosynthesis C-methylase UbiE
VKHAVEIAQADLDYFQKGQQDNKKYWRRLGGMPNFKGKRVLDIGCGWGALCIDIAARDAAEVVGIDLAARRVDFAKANLQQNFIELAPLVHFQSTPIQALEQDSYFDVIVSKDTFEHIHELDEVIEHAYRLLKPGGVLITGFGPLYHSMYGDHKSTQAVLPWFHLIIPERLLIKRLNKRMVAQVNSIKDLGLNMMSYKDYEACFNRSLFDIEFYAVNASDNWVVKFFNLLRRIPGLTKYFTQSIYCIMRKPKP